MPLTLDNLPFDVLFFISQLLDIDDIVHLSLTCRQLRLLLQESTLCRYLVQAHASYSYEAQLIKTKKREEPLCWKKALLQIYHRRQAFANASPVSASLVGYGSDFCQRNGVLSYLTQNRFIHALELLPETGARYTIDLWVILHPYHPELASNQSKVSLMNYNDGILVVLCELLPPNESSWLLALRIDDFVPDFERLVALLEIESGSKLFVRHNRSYIYYGTHSGIGEHGHHEWEIRGLSLDLKKPLPADLLPIQLENFVGSDLGSTVVFDIHGEYFYGLSNQTSFDLEEVDWTSFYRCVRFPLSNPSRSSLQVDHRIYRRPHKEGPINDLWTDLSLQVDERTNSLVIVEARREWLRGGSKQYRTFYTQRLEFKSFETSDADIRSAAMDFDPMPTMDPPLPLDDPLTQVIDSTNHPRYEPPRVRKPTEAHPEHGSELVGDPNSYTFARTKFRGYDLSSSAFLDIVEDSDCCPHVTATPCLKLRIGSRRPAPLLNQSDPSIDMEDRANIYTLQPPVPEPETQFLSYHYRYSPIQLWPRPTASASTLANPMDTTAHVPPQLHAIVNPPRFAFPLPPNISSSSSATSVAVSIQGTSSASSTTSYSSVSSFSPPYTRPHYPPSRSPHLSRYRHITASLSSFFVVYQIRFAKDGVSAPSGEGAIVCVAFDKKVNLNGSREIWYKGQSPESPTCLSCA